MPANVCRFRERYVNHMVLRKLCLTRHIDLRAARSDGHLLTGRALCSRYSEIEGKKGILWSAEKRWAELCLLSAL